jgi:hypothetical protein
MTETTDLKGDTDLMIKAKDKVLIVVNIELCMSRGYGAVQRRV